MTCDKINRSKKYTIADVAALLDMDIQTVIEWRTLGVLNDDNQEIYKLKCFRDGDKYYVFGKDLMQFFDDINL